MKTQPIRPARIVFDDQGLPLAPDFNDRYHPAAGALAQAEHVFLRGNDLPARWAGREHFTVLELGFGLGLNFLATWLAWQADPQRPRWLHYVGLDLHPPEAGDLARAHAAALPARAQGLAARLREAWPPATPNLHPLELGAGRVRLLLGWGDAAALLPVLRLQADAIYLDGFAPGRDPQRNAAMWSPRLMQAVARRAAPGATAATWCAARGLREALTAEGFEVRAAPGLAGKREITLARHAPRYRPPPLPDGRPLAHGAGDAPPGAAAAPEGCPRADRCALVVGGGIAGASAAQALAALGWTVTVLDRHPQPAAEASGNAAGLFHGTVNPDDGPYARLFRAAALQAAQAVATAAAQGVPAGTDGLLRLQTLDGSAEATLGAMQALLQRLGLPAGYVQALSALDASARAGVLLPAPAWFYPGGGWIAPGAWVRQLLATPGVHWRGGVAVQRLRRETGLWQACDADGRCIAAAPLLVLAGGAAGPALLAPWQSPPWPLRCTRGQVSGFAGVSPLRLAVAGDGYALPGDGALWCGATRQAASLPATDESPPTGGASGGPGLPVWEADHAHNLQRLQRLTGLAPPPGAPLLGRSGLRLHTDDRLPLAGALPDAAQAWPRPQGMLAPRWPGLYVLGALGARGLTLAPLLARLVAAQATGTPWPLEQDLADAVDPVRWRVRTARRGDAAA